jgi:hypothetical protein
MKYHRFLVAAFFFLAALSASAQDFRKVTWGMSPEEVISAESGLQFSRMNGTANTMLSTRVDVTGHSGLLNYIFQDDKLVIAQYRFDDEEDMRTYNEILNALTDKYGAPYDSGDSYSRWKLERTYVGISFKDNLCRVDYADQKWVADTREKRRAEYDSNF